MRIAFDTETALIRPGRMAPELACVSWANDAGAFGILHWEAPELPGFLRKLLSHEQIIGHNVAFDNAVICAQFPELLPLVFKAYDESRMTDTMLRQQLIDIATGEFRGFRTPDGAWKMHTYGLDACAHRYGLSGKEHDEWRLKYGQLRDSAMSCWPQDAVAYALTDAKQTLEIFMRQGVSRVPDEEEQARAFFALQLASVWGLKTSSADVKKLEYAANQEYAKLQEMLQKENLVRANGTRDTKVAQQRISAAFKINGGTPRLTEQGAYQLNKEACFACNDPVLEAYSEYSTLGKTLSTDIPILLSGEQLPIHTRFKLLETTRVGSSGPNVQNIRRAVGIRECFIPRPGWAIVDVDYPALELRTLAQIQYEWFGKSTLGEALNAGSDPHTVVAARILNQSLEETQQQIEDQDEQAVQTRGAAKICNFGFPGGLGIDTFVKFALLSYGVHITRERALALKAAWIAAWPEMPQYFSKINACKDPETELYTILHVGSGMVRRCESFTAAANAPFQTLGATCAKRGLWLVCSECYNKSDSPLSGARVVNFIHDQLLVEIPYSKWGVSRSDLAAKLVAQRFDDGAAQYLTKVKIKCKPIITERWSKHAKQVFNEAGQLVPWRNAEETPVQ